VLFRSLILVGANSPAGLRSTPVGRVVLDELDAYPYSLGEEGDPVELALLVGRKMFKIGAHLGHLSVKRMLMPRGKRINFNDQIWRKFYLLIDPSSRYGQPALGLEMGHLRRSASKP